VSSFTCYVCLPEVKGPKASRDLAMLWRANITRTWPVIMEPQMGECSELANTAKFLLQCPTDDEYSVCTKISNDYWFGLTCGRATQDHGNGEYDMGNYTLFNCPSSLCVSPAAAPAPSAVPVMACILWGVIKFTAFF
ncbi:uncharacterized protein LOC108671610, partial [Hyalella azteca]|uniref:Uncharacterized protein LOC108671610 n=1 Tax=Hyalella azteca TaxID=294128 RepID=A0A8B7NNB7_HYAAZ